MTTAYGADDSLGIPAKVLRGRARRRRLRIGLMMALLALLAAVALLALLGKRTPEPRYRLAPVERRTIASVVEATGFLDVEQRVQVPAPNASRLARVLVSEGDQVKGGDLLAELDASAAEIELEGARAALSAAAGAVAEARAGVAAADDTLSRLVRLEARGLAAKAELAEARANADKARAVLKAARGRYAVAERELEAKKLSLGTLDLRAPRSGVVLKAPVVLGAIVGPEQEPLFVIGSPLETLRIDARVAEADIGQVRPGQQVTFTVPAFPGRKFDAEISELGLEGQRQSGTVLYPLVLRAQNPERLLLPGMSARLSIRVATAENVLSVRDAALRFTPEAQAEPPSTPRVWVSEDGVKARSVDVEVGVSDGVFTQVKPRQPGTLAEGDKVVIGRVVTDAASDGGPGISLRRR